MIVRMTTDHPAAGTDPASFSTGLVRAGETLFGNATPAPIEGWISPTYGVKYPALSFSMTQANPGNVSFTTEFIFPIDVKSADEPPHP
jgi:hypothetical protein